MISFDMPRDDQKVPEVHAVETINQLACLAICLKYMLMFLIYPTLSGVRVIAGAAGDLPSVVDSHQLGAALGGLEDAASSASASSNNSAEGDSRSDGQGQVLLCCSLRFFKIVPIYSTPLCRTSDDTGDPFLGGEGTRHISFPNIFLARPTVVVIV